MLWLLAFAAADLPTHCLLGDAAGEWVFQLSAPSEELNACGHTAPNSVSSMLAINRSALVEGGETVRITLTEEIEDGAEPAYAKAGMGLLRHARSGRRMVARDEHGNVGSWTMIFDTGFEVRVGGRSIMVGFDFRLLPQADGTPKTGDVWDKIAFYEGRREGEAQQPDGGLYVCECDSTSGGWANLPDGKHACAIADKASKTEVARSFATEARDGKLRKYRADELDRSYERAAPAKAEAKATANASSVRAHLDELHEALDDAHALHKEIKTELKGSSAAKTSVHAALDGLAGVLRDEKAAKPEKAKAKDGDKAKKESAKEEEPSKVAAKADTKDAEVQTPRLRGAAAPAALPEGFDWRDELKLMDGSDALGEEMDQGACGSCWAFTSSAVFQSRLRIGLYRKYGSLVPINIDWTDTFSCNPYGEGCSGGWNLQAARFLHDFGIRELKTPTTAADKTSTCDWQKRNSSDKVYARDYGYVGGFSHGATVEALQREIFAFGPVAASINTNAITNFWNGNEGKVIVKFNNFSMPKEEFSRNEDVGDWYYTTHAVVLVGWGVSEDEPAVPYWIVRNSWGPGWGDGGYGYVRRGQNDAALEASAVWIDPDLDRLPASFKRKAHGTLTHFGFGETGESSSSVSVSGSQLVRPSA